MTPPGAYVIHVISDESRVYYGDVPLSSPWTMFAQYDLRSPFEVPIAYYGFQSVDKMNRWTDGFVLFKPGPPGFAIWSEEAVLESMRRFCGKIRPSPVMDEAAARHLIRHGRHQTLLAWFRSVTGSLADVPHGELADVLDYESARLVMQS